MVDKEKTSVAGLDMELYYPPENANFTFWVFVFKPVCPTRRMRHPLMNCPKAASGSMKSS